MKKQENASTETVKKEDFGFVGYRDYKSSDFYKRYEAARAKLPENALKEVSGEVSCERKKSARGNAIAAAVFAFLFVAFCAVGFFILPENALVKVETDSVTESLFGLFDGKDIVSCVMGIIDGTVTGIIEMAGIGTLVLSILLAVLAFIGGIVDAATGRGIGKLMKLGCTVMFFSAVVSLAIVLIGRLDLTIGISVAIIIAGVVSLCAVTAPNKIKEKKQ